MYVPITGILLWCCRVSADENSPALRAYPTWRLCAGEIQVDGWAVVGCKLAAVARGRSGWLPFLVHVLLVCWRHDLAGPDQHGQFEQPDVRGDSRPSSSPRGPRGPSPVLQPR